jgi:hypothetical protein
MGTVIGVFVWRVIVLVRLARPLSGGPPTR